MSDTFTLELPVQLTDEEVLSRYREMGDILGRLDALNSERRDRIAKFRETGRELSERIKRLREAVAGVEKRPVNCSKVRGDGPDREVVRLDTGELVLFCLIPDKMRQAIFPFQHEDGE